MIFNNDIWEHSAVEISFEDTLKEWYAELMNFVQLVSDGLGQVEPAWPSTDVLPPLVHQANLRKLSKRKIHESENLGLNCVAIKICKHVTHTKLRPFLFCLFGQTRNHVSAFLTLAPCSTTGGSIGRPGPHTSPTSAVSWIGTPSTLYYLP